MMDGVCQKLVYFIIHPFIITLQSTKPNPVHQTLDPARRNLSKRAHEFVLQACLQACHSERGVAPFSSL